MKNVAQLLAEPVKQALLAWVGRLAFILAHGWVKCAGDARAKVGAGALEVAVKGQQTELRVVPPSAALFGAFSPVDVVGAADNALKIHAHSSGCFTSSDKPHIKLLASFIVIHAPS